MVFHVILVELILTVVWWSTRDFQSRSCILQHSLTPWKFEKLESQFQDWSLCEDSESSNHDVMDHRSWESKVNWRIEYIAINSWENRYPRLWNAGCNDSVCIEEDSQLAHSILEKNMCRRATCSKIRPILTRKTDFAHDLWAFSCTQSLWNRFKDSHTCSLYVSRMMMSKIFDVRWYQAQLSADEPLSDKVLEGL